MRSAGVFIHADDDPAALRAMVEQWRTQSSMLSDMVRELQESEKAAWRAANEAREQAVREARATLLQAACGDLAATLRAELATERQANTRMQQLLRAQEEKISLLEQMLQSTRDLPHDGSSSGVVAAQSWLPRWLGTSANGSSSGGAGGGSGSGSGGDGGGDGGGTNSSGGNGGHESSGATEEAAWSRWLPLPRPSAAATPIKAQAWHSQTATPSVTAARAAPPAAASSAAAGGVVTNVAAAAKATPKATATAAAAAPPLSPIAGEDSAAGVAPPPPATPLAEWTCAQAAARRLQLELRTEPRKRASAVGGGGAGGAAHVECFLESFLHTVERGGAIGGSAMVGGGSATGGGAQSIAADEADATNALTPARGSSAHDAAADDAAAVADADVVAGSPCVDLDVPAGVDLVDLEMAAAAGAVPSAADLAVRRGLCLQPCVVVALGATHDDRVPGVGYRPSPPVTTRVRHAGSPGSTHRSGGSSASRADLCSMSSACSTVTLSSVPSTDRSAG